MATKQPTPQGISALLRKLTPPPADPLTRTCPYCHAQPGEPCVNTAWGGAMYRPHFMRTED